MTGLVLAGGASTRMGCDKALLVVDGVRLVDAAVAVLAQVCDHVLLAARDRAIDVAAETIADADGEGPLAGIVAGLRHARTPLLAVLAVDMPQASPYVFSALAGLWAGEAGVAPAVAGIVQPLHAVYATDAADRFAAQLAAGERSPRRALETLGARIVAAGELTEDTRFATNLNEPAGLRRPEGPAPTAHR